MACSLIVLYKGCCKLFCLIWNNFSIAREVIIHDLEVSFTVVLREVCKNERRYEIPWYTREVLSLSVDEQSQYKASKTRKCAYNVSASQLVRRMGQVIKVADYDNPCTLVHDWYRKG